MPIIEEIKVTGESLVKTVEDLIHEGNVNHIVLKNADGHTLLEFPVTIGVLGIVIAPVLAAVGAIGALVFDVTILVTRPDSAPPVQSPPAHDSDVVI